MFVFHDGVMCVVIQEKPPHGEYAINPLDAVCVAGFLLGHRFGRRSMAEWVGADMWIVLLYQLFGWGRSKPHQHPVSREACFVSTPRLQLRPARRTRFNHMHHSCLTETRCSKPDTDIRNHAESYSA